MYEKEINEVYILNNYAEGEYILKDIPFNIIEKNNEPLIDNSNFYHKYIKIINQGIENNILNSNLKEFFTDDFEFICKEYD